MPAPSANSLLPSTNTAPTASDVPWTFANTAFQDALNLSSLQRDDPFLLNIASQSGVLGELIKDAGMLALQGAFFTPGYVSGETLNAFDNALLSFDSLAIGLGGGSANLANDLLQPLFGPSVKF